MSDSARVNRLRTAIMRNKGELECILGNSAGQVYAGKSRYWVRYPTGVDESGVTKYSKALPIRYAGEGAIPERKNVEVLVRIDYDNVLSVYRVHPNYYDRANIDSRTYNPIARSSPFMRLKNVVRWLTRPPGSDAGTPSTKITRRENPVFVDNYLDLSSDPGTILAASKPDLASFVPDVGYHCVVCVFYDTLNQEHFAAASTAQLMTVALDSTDDDECFAQLEHNEYVPLLSLVLADAQGTIDINDYRHDLRQLVNAPRVYGVPNPIAADKAVIVRSTHQLNYHFDCTVLGTMTVLGTLNVI